MSSYNYGYSGGSGGKKKNSDWFSWALVVFLFATGAWPIALILLLVKLSDGGKKKRKEEEQQFPPLYTAQAPGALPERLRASLLPSPPGPGRRPSA